MFKRFPLLAIGAMIMAVLGAGWVGFQIGAASRSEPSSVESGERAKPPASDGNAEMASRLANEDGLSERRPAMDLADREAGLRTAMRRFSAAELKRTVERLQAEASKPRRDRDLSLALELLARLEPQRALELAGREKQAPVRTMLVSSVVGGWMWHDPSAALAWAARAQQPEYADAAFAQLAQFDAQHAWSLAAALNDQPASFRWNAFRAVLDGRLWEGEFAEARAWVERSTEPGLQLFLAARVADTWVRHQPEAAAAWTASLPESGERAQIFVNVGSTWAAGEPRAAAEFAVELPAGESRQQMLTHVLLEWVANDLAEASRWVDQLSPYPENDVAVAAIATDPNLIKVNPEVALSWAESLVAGDSRMHAMETVVAQWASRDASAAREYLAIAPGLDRQERDRLLAAIGDAAPTD